MSPVTKIAGLATSALALLAALDVPEDCDFCVSVFCSSTCWSVGLSSVFGSSVFPEPDHDPLPLPLPLTEDPLPLPELLPLELLFPLSGGGGLLSWV